jgi:hypothetical protein
MHSGFMIAKFVVVLAVVFGGFILTFIFLGNLPVPRSPRMRRMLAVLGGLASPFVLSLISNLVIRLRR